MLNEWFGWDGVTSGLVIAGILIVVIAIMFVIQTKRMKRSLMGKVLAIQGNVRSNIRTCRKYQKVGILNRLKTEGWEKNRQQADFLPEELLTDMDKVFARVKELNQRIDGSADGYLNSRTDSVDISGFAELQQDVGRRLDKWVMGNYYNEKYVPRRRGIFKF